MTDSNEFEALKAEIKRHDADPENIAVVRKDELEDLRETREEQADEIDELEGDVASLEEDLSELEDEVTAAKEVYAEALADVSVLHDKEDLMEFGMADLRDRYEKLDEEQKVDDLSGLPDPKSGDVDKGNQTSTEQQEEIESLREKQEFLEQKTGILAEKELERVEDRLAELTGE